MAIGTILTRFTPFDNVPGVSGKRVYEECNGWNGVPEDIDGMIVEIAACAGEG